MRSLRSRSRSRSRFKIHNDLYIDTVVQSQSTILNTNTIDSEEVYTRFLSNFVKVRNEKHTVRCLLHFIYNLVGPSLVFNYSPQRIIRIVPLGLQTWNFCVSRIYFKSIIPSCSQCHPLLSLIYSDDHYFAVFVLVRWYWKFYFYRVFYQSPKHILMFRMYWNYHFCP